MKNFLRFPKKVGVASRLAIVATLLTAAPSARADNGCLDAGNDADPSACDAGSDAADNDAAADAGVMVPTAPVVMGEDGNQCSTSFARGTTVGGSAMGIALVLLAVRRRSR